MSNLSVEAKPLGKSSTILADLAVLAIAIVWGASYPVTKNALIDAPVLVIIFYRFFTTTCIMSVLARRELLSAARGDVLRAVILGTVLSAIFTAEIAGIALSSATNAALLISLCTLFTPMLEYGLARQLPPRIVVLGAVIAFAGVAMLVGGISTWSLGDTLILIAAGLRAIMVVSTKRLMIGRSLSSKALTGVQSLVVSAFAFAALCGLQGPEAVVVSAGMTFWGSIVFLSLFCTVAAFYVQNAAVRRTSPTRVGFLMGTEPLFGFALSCLLLSEPVTTLRIVGAAMIVGGTFLGLFAERSETRF